MLNANSYYKQTGTAIFMALLVVSIVTALSIQWFAQMRINVRYTKEILLSEQTYLFAQGVVDWGIAALTINDTIPKILSKTMITPYQGVIVGRVDQYFQKKTSDMVNIKKEMASPLREYFLLRTEILFSNQHLILYSLLHRTIINEKVQITVIWQCHGLI